MSSDLDLQRQKRALELRRKMLQSQAKPFTAPRPKPAESPHDIVRKILAGRGPEVMETARRYYPAEIERLEARIAALITEGRLRGPISAEELYAFLRRLGLVFSMDVKIRIKEHGELKSIEEKLRKSST
ncbi:MAG TPA: DNA-binding protein [Candidatus Bathyarchaeia archaeon]|nr:DNA-binding protein [Candidatus Bathyarchaeia archaeon]